jgi:hypothetical protein
MRDLLFTAALTLGLAQQSAHAAADLVKLHEQVVEWRKHASQTQLDRAATSEAAAAGCPESAAHEDPLKHNGVAFRVGDDEYVASVLGMDDGKVCLLMRSPVSRPLSLAEAIDIEAALVMIADLPVIPHVPTAAETQAAEANLAALLAAVRGGDHEPFDKRHPPSPLDFADVVDCSHVNPDATPHGGRLLGYVYNNAYAWTVIARENATRCVYLDAPFNRGLDAADGADFLKAQVLRLEPRAPDAPNFERTVRAALERFGGQAGTDEPSMPRDLIDCTDFERMPGDSGDDVSDGGWAWLSDGAYTFAYYHLAKGTCAFVANAEESRGLRAPEARAMIRAARTGLDDPAHRTEQRDQNCFAKAWQSHAANVPDYDEGMSNGRRYRVFYVALDPDLKRLDEVQHAYAASRREAWARGLTASGAASDLDIHFRKVGRTNELARLDAWETQPGNEDSGVADKEWLLHVPSGRFIAFEDLFADPVAVHQRIATRYINEDLPGYLENDMTMLAFLGDDPEQQARDYRARYLEEGHRIAAKPVAHYVHVAIGASGERAPALYGDFSEELLPSRVPASWRVEIKDVIQDLKPEFRHVLDGVICRPPT